MTTIKRPDSRRVSSKQTLALVQSPLRKSETAVKIQNRITMISKVGSMAVKVI